jgi:predicted NAD/FAD-dependent oxidoreductase
MVADSGILVVGAGVSGLAFAQVLAGTKGPITILERARGVGGRCTTRRIEGQPLDLGPVFLHGRSPAFRQALEFVPSKALPGWPEEIRGTGRPCQPEAFTPGERRFAFAEGLSSFPKWLATGQAIQTEVEVTGLEVAGPCIRLQSQEGPPREADTVVLALAPEQILRLLDVSTSFEVAAPLAASTLRALLTLSCSEPSLTLAALYPAEVPLPSWHVCYPEDSRILQLVSHDSSKREGPTLRALVFQAHARWSGEHFEDPRWPELLLAEAGRIVGSWAATPLHRHLHRWRFARTDRSGEMAAPLLFHLPGGARLGVCGDRFAPGGGVEGAWLSGTALAKRVQLEDA